jgi:peptide-methionine (S)-S-oxide reductase
MLFGSSKKTTMPVPQDALKGRENPINVLGEHPVLGTPMGGPYPEGVELIYFGMGCFWGAERALWQTPGVWTTAVGYAGGYTPNPTYEETCTGRTGHAEVVLVAYDPSKITTEQLLKVFWEAHDPTQGMRQGNDVGTTYRSAIYTTTPAQLEAAKASRDQYAAKLRDSGYGAVTTEIAAADTFYPAEDYHQQYLYKVPNGYCSMTGTGVSCPIGLITS